MKKNNPRVSIGISVYKGEKYIDETIKSILAQSWKNFTVLISVDGNDRQSAKICRKYLKDPRFKMHLHTKRLGWFRNFEWLMRHYSGDYWYYHQQDDLTEPDYIKTLVTYAQKHPKAAIVFSDIVCFGARNNPLRQESVTGTPLDREIKLLKNHVPSVAFRGLVPGDIIEKVPALRDNIYNSFCSDETWIATIARYGELHRVPKPLYKKRYHAANVQSSWAAQSDSWLELGWTRHCIDIYLEALPVAKNGWERFLIFAAAMYRILFGAVAKVLYARPNFWLPLKRLARAFHFLWVISGANGLLRIAP